VDVVSGLEIGKNDTMMSMESNGDFILIDFSDFLEYKIKVKAYNTGKWSTDDTDFVINLKIYEFILPNSAPQFIGPDHAEVTIDLNNDESTVNHILLITDEEGDSFTTTISGMESFMTLFETSTIVFDKANTITGHYILQITIKDEKGASSTSELQLTVKIKEEVVETVIEEELEEETTEEPDKKKEESAAVNLAFLNKFLNNMFGGDEAEDNKNETKKIEEVKFTPLKLTVAQSNDQLVGEF